MTESKAFSTGEVTDYQSDYLMYLEIIPPGGPAYVKTFFMGGDCYNDPIEENLMRALNDYKLWRYKNGKRD